MFLVVILFMNCDISLCFVVLGENFFVLLKCVFFIELNFKVSCQNMHLMQFLSIFIAELKRLLELSLISCFFTFIWASFYHLLTFLIIFTAEYMPLRAIVGCASVHDWETESVWSLFIAKLHDSG